MTIVRSSIDLWERFFRDAPDAVLVVQRDGAIVDANDQAARLFGYAADELTELRVDTLLPERFRHDHQHLRDGFIGLDRSNPTTTSTAPP